MFKNVLLTLITDYNLINRIREILNATQSGRKITIRELEVNDTIKILPKKPCISGLQLNHRLEVNLEK